MKLTFADIEKIAKRTPDRANTMSALKALDLYAVRFGLDQPHRLAQFLAQALHESADFHYDREIWGPTAQQLKYDSASGSQLSKDLGNTKAGDGKRFFGRTGFMLTGRSNYRAFTAWVQSNIDAGGPDFEANPEAVNTDPWEGLVPLWYWSTRDLNRYADSGDIEMVTKKINGGLNGYADRLDYLARTSLVLLGYRADEVRAFQQTAGLVIDGDVGPRTRAALHQALVRLTDAPARAVHVAAAPVVAEKAVAPAALDKPVEKTSGFWERIGTIGSALSGIGAAVFGDWRVAAVAGVIVIVIAGFGLLFHSRIVAAVRELKAEVAT